VSNPSDQKLIIEFLDKKPKFVALKENVIGASQGASRVDLRHESSTVGYKMMMIE